MARKGWVFDAADRCVLMLTIPVIPSTQHLIVFSSAVDALCSHVLCEPIDTESASRVKTATILHFD